MASTVLPFAVPFSVTGLPTGDSSAASASMIALTAAVHGASDCFNWVYPYGGVVQLANALPVATPTIPGNDNGDFFFSIEITAEKSAPAVQVSIQSTTAMDLDVVNNGANPTSVTFNGETYNVVGSIETTISFNGVTAWSVALPLTLLASVPTVVLSSIALKAFLVPILGKIYAGLRTALQTEVEDGMSEAAIDAAADAAADVAEISEEAIEEAGVDAVLSLETGGLAMVGFVALIALQVGIELIIHPSYHQVLIYNLTPYDLNWGAPVLMHDATITMMPVTNTTGNTPSQTLPAMSESSPSKWVAPVNMASMAQFSLYSDSEMYGVKWGLSFNLFAPGTTTEMSLPAAAMWDIPLGSSNSIGVGLNVPQSNLNSWVDSEEGKHNDVQLSALVSMSDGRTVLVANSIDYLHDTHPMSPGSTDTGYIYRSVLIFQLQS